MPKVARESLIGTTYRGIDFCDCSRRIGGGLIDRGLSVAIGLRLGCLQGSLQIHGSLSQLPYKCHFDEVAFVGD